MELQLVMWYCDIDLHIYPLSDWITIKFMSIIKGGFRGAPPPPKIFTNTMFYYNNV